VGNTVEVVKANQAVVREGEEKKKKKKEDTKNFHPIINCSTLYST
jgi:hypothetical protein